MASRAGATKTATPGAPKTARPGKTAAKAPLAGTGRLGAELKALGAAHGAAVTQRNRVFEALLGIDSSGAKPQPLFKLPTFEDLFDERVARSLGRLGTAQALADLRTQLAAIDKRLRRVEQLLDKPRARR